MSVEVGSLDYALARQQARRGRHADAADWQRLETPRTGAALIDAVRATPLAPLLAGVPAGIDGFEAEAHFRRLLAARIDEVARWLPPPWQGALRWCAVLPELAALQRLARDGVATPWLLADREGRALAEAAPQARRGRLAATRWAPLAAAWPDADRFGAAWRAQWRRRWPSVGAESRATLQALDRLLARHAGAFAADPAGDGRVLRDELRGRLLAIARLAALQPAAIFANLALEALDIERLRGELLRRLHFPRWPEA